MSPQVWVGSEGLGLTVEALGFGAWAFGFGLLRLLGLGGFGGFRVLAL